MRICVMTGAIMHWAWAVAQKPFDAAARQSFTREVAASHLVSPSRLQVSRQSYILEVSHIHLGLCDWRRSLKRNSMKIVASCSPASCYVEWCMKKIATLDQYIALSGKRYKIGP